MLLILYILFEMVLQFLGIFFFVCLFAFLVFFKKVYFFICSDYAET